ncbi:MAG: type IV pilus assembly protein PilM [Patescibacteria group bacterium]
MLFNSQLNIIGLDISERSLKAFQFSKGFQGRCKLQAASDVELVSGIIKDGQIVEPENMVQAIKQLLAYPKKGNFIGHHVVACLPETKTFIKMIDIPPMSREEIAEAIKWEAEHHIPIPIAETYWDWELVKKRADEKRLPILLGVAPKELVDNYTQVLNDANLVTVALEIEAMSLVRSLINNANEQRNEATMIIDLGYSRTSLCVYDRDTIQFTVNVPISGSKMTQEISKTLSLTEVEAEKAKIICGFDPKKCRGAMQQILNREIDHLIKRIKETFSFYHEHFPQSDPIKKITLCGGGANFKLIDSYLAQALDMKVVRGNPWCNILGLAPPFSSSIMLSYTTAIGLALRPVAITYA